MVDAKKIEDGNETQVKRKNENEKPPTRQYHFEYDPFSLAPPSDPFLLSTTLHLLSRSSVHFLREKGQSA